MKQIWIRDEDHEKLREAAHQGRTSIVAVAGKAIDMYFEARQSKKEKNPNKGGDTSGG